MIIIIIYTYIRIFKIYVKLTQLISQRCKVHIKIMNNKKQWTFKFWQQLLSHLAQVELSFFMIEPIYVYMLWAIGNTWVGIGGKERNG